MSLDTLATSCEFRRCPLFLIADGFVANGPVEDRVVQARDGFLRCGKHVKYDDFVFASFEPWARNIERLLWAGAPEAAQVVAVDPNDSFAKLAGVEEGVASGGEGEVGLQEVARRWIRGESA
jgi:hypothetical protein